MREILHEGIPAHVPARIVISDRLLESAPCRLSAELGKMVIHMPVAVTPPFSSRHCTPSVVRRQA